MLKSVANEDENGVAHLEHEIGNLLHLHLQEKGVAANGTCNALVNDASL